MNLESVVYGVSALLGVWSAHLIFRSSAVYVGVRMKEEALQEAGRLHTVVIHLMRARTESDVDSALLNVSDDDFKLLRDLLTELSVYHPRLRVRRTLGHVLRSRAAGQSR